MTMTTTCGTFSREGRYVSFLFRLLNNNVNRYRSTQKSSKEQSKQTVDRLLLFCAPRDGDVKAEFAQAETWSVVHPPLLWSNIYKFIQITTLTTVTPNIIYVTKATFIATEPLDHRRNSSHESELTSSTWALFSWVQLLVTIVTTTTSSARNPTTQQQPLLDVRVCMYFVGVESCDGWWYFELGILADIL